MALRRYRCFRILLPHFIVLFTFSCYIFLGACGLYFLVFPSSSGIENDFAYDDSNGDRLGRIDSPSEADYIEMNIDIPCSEAKKRLEELNQREFERIRKSTSDQLKKFTFTRAVLICFNWISTIGNRFPAEWEHQSDASDIIKPGLISKFYPVIYMLLGIPLTFVALVNYSALFYDALNNACFAVRRKWHSKMIMTKSEKKRQLRRDVENSRLWNPLWFMLLLIAYVLVGAVLARQMDTQLSLTDAVWNCAALVLAIGETSGDVFVLPSSALNCFAQICYSILGLILMGAFLRSFLPLAAKIYEPNPYQVKKRAITDKTVSNSERVTLMEEGGGSVHRIIPKSIVHRWPSPTPSPHRSILRQKNGAYSFELKRGDSMESVESEDLLGPPVVRFAVPMQPMESMRVIESRQHAPTSGPQQRNARSQMTATNEQNGSFNDIHGSLVFHVAPESIPFADARTSTLIM